MGEEDSEKDASPPKLNKADSEEEFEKAGSKLYGDDDDFEEDEEDGAANGGADGTETGKSAPSATPRSSGSGSEEFERFEQSDEEREQKQAVQKGASHHYSDDSDFDEEEPGEDGAKSED